MNRKQEEEKNEKKRERKDKGEEKQKKRQKEQKKDEKNKKMKMKLDMKMKYKKMKAKLTTRKMRKDKEGEEANRLKEESITYISPTGVKNIYSSLAVGGINTFFKHIVDGTLVKRN